MFNASHLKLSFGSRVILDDISISLLPKDKVALVGQNGVGKSSLLNILSGLEIPDSGLIEMPKQIRLGFLKQVPDLDSELSVIETVSLGMTEHLAQIEEHKLLCHELSSVVESSLQDKLLKKIDELSFKIEQKGGFDVDYLVERVLSRLGVNARAQKIGTLSGGERRRVDLARILLLSPDIYLLDEPTNHLDMSAISFLIDTFAKSKAAVLFVSHDRRFIDELATKILELSNGKLYSHELPFANYLENKLIRELIDERSLHRRERLLISELSWLRSGTPARTTKQNARIERAHELIDQVSKDYQIQEKKRLEIQSLNVKRLGNTIIELNEVGAAYGDKILFRNFNLKVGPAERFGIIGKNGSGKTTLLSILAKKILPTYGEVVFGKNTEVIQFDQQRKELNPECTLKETLADHGDYVHISGKNIHIASYLEKYLFSGSDANRKVATLSGGEQNRLLLAKLFRHSFNCLLLDEPTNDLDITSLSVLEEVLLNYEGVAFIVSHDQKFLDRVCTSIIAFEENDEKNESSLRVYLGNYSDYLHSRPTFEKEGLSLKKESLERENKRQDVKIKKRRSYKEEREFKDIENIINGREKEREAINEELANSEIFRSPKLAQEKLARLKELEIEIEELYARWQILMDLGDFKK